jgi:hypothetical protein
MKKLTLKMLLLGLAVFAAHSTASAQVLTALNPTTPAVLTTITSPNYYLFDARNNMTTTIGDVNAAPSYASVSDAGSQLYVTGSTEITAGGVTYDSGVAYNAPSPTNLATVTLTGAPASFNLGVFLDYNDSTVYTLNLYSASATLLSTAVLNPSQAPDNTPVTNQFYYANVAGATAAGDYIVVSGNTGGGQATVGGLTFDPATTPEPSTYALVLAGLGTLALVARLRRTA